MGNFADMAVEGHFTLLFVVFGVGRQRVDRRGVEVQEIPQYVRLSS